MTWTKPPKEGDLFRAEDDVQTFAKKGDVFRAHKIAGTVNIFPLSGKYRNGRAAHSGIPIFIGKWEKL